MKKTILSLLSLLLIGNFCLADNTGNYKKIISANADNQDMFAELTDTLERQKLTDEEYQAMTAHFNSLLKPSQEKEFLGNITETEISLSNMAEADNLQGVNQTLLNTYPEFIQTCMEGPLTEALTKNPKLQIKELTSDRDYTKATFTLTAVTTTGKKINATCENKDALPLIMELWENADKKQLQNYRALHKQYPIIVKMVDDYVYEKTGKKYNKIHPFKCHTNVEVYDINTSDKNEYWDNVDCMPVLYRYNKGSNNYQYAAIAFPNYYPIYHVKNMVKVDGYIWYDTLTPRDNPPSFDPFDDFAPTPINYMNHCWVSRKILFNERDLGSEYMNSNNWKEGNPKGKYIPNNGIFPIIKLTDDEKREILGTVSTTATSEYKLGYYCGEHFAIVYKDHSKYPAKWKSSMRSYAEAKDFIPNKTYNCDSFNPILIRRISKVMYPEVFTKPINSYY